MEINLDDEASLIILKKYLGISYVIKHSPLLHNCIYYPTENYLSTPVTEKVLITDRSNFKSVSTLYSYGIYIILMLNYYYYFTTTIILLLLP